MFFTAPQTGYLDLETRSPVDIKGAGAYRYMSEADAILLPYALGPRAVQLVSVKDFSRPLAWADMPDPFKAFHEQVVAGHAIWCAWNSPFDRAAWNYATADFPWLEPWHIIDAMVQGTASGLPPALDMAGQRCGIGGKQKDGKALINLFSVIGGKHEDGTPQSHPDEWARFQSYAMRDVEQLRGVYLQTRPLPIREWQEFWASEAINERGVGIDVPLAEAAAAMALADKERSAEQLTKLTAGAVPTVTAVPSMRAWLTAPGRLDETARQFIVKREAEFEEDENDPDVKVEVRKIKTSLSRKRAGLAILYLKAKPDRTPEEREALELLELREFGGSATPAKFTRMLAQQIDGVIMGQYSFSGAPQTGRFCVAPDTLIDTPDGPRKIVNLTAGSFVVGCSGKPCRVLAKIYKGRERMYRLAGPRGEFVVATAAHQILTRHGWTRIDVCFEETTDGCFRLRRGCEPVSVYEPHDRDDREDPRNHTSHDFDYPETRSAAGRISPAESGGLFPQQDRGEQSDARRSLRSRAHPASRSSIGVERQRLHVRASYHYGEGFGSAEYPGGVGGSPYRWRYHQQQLGQSGFGDEGWTPASSQASTWTLVPVGEGEVWDISVEGDASYIAQGMIHHNSGKGVQVQNLLRDALPYELDAIDALTQGCDIEAFATLGDDPTAVSRKLSMLIRPSLIARPGKAFVWSDWSQIEARVLPWLSASEGGDRRLDIFREVDADPSVPDLYTRTASDLSHLPVDKVDKDLRQRGKVAELALGFGGGVGALHAMGANYGLYLPPEEAKEIVTRWRAANSWAVDFWDQLWDAITIAMKMPGAITGAGRVCYLYDRVYMGGTLFCELPSGRLLTYAKLRHEEVDILDDDDEVVGREVQLRFARGFGRAKLWKGLAAENVVQATAADVLRGTLLRLEADPSLKWMPVRLHTHDEILVECDEARAPGAALVLRREMQRGFDWSDGLPINSDETIARFYTKATGSIGL